MAVRTRTRKRGAVLSTAGSSASSMGGEVAESQSPASKAVNDSSLKAKVAVEGAVTRNVGNYNSIRCHVRAEIPCEPTPEGMDKAYSWLSDWVDDKLQRELDLALGGDDE